MRTIKFRGKRAKGECVGEWAYGELTQHDNLIWLEECHYFSGAYVQPDTIGQFTGCLDANGKEIYEGDIVKHPYIDPIFWDLVESKDGDGATSEVVFHDGAFCVKYGINDFIYLDSFTRHGHAEVVGNIYDNPELINK